MAELVTTGGAPLATVTDEVAERLLSTWLATLDSAQTRRAYASAVREALGALGGLERCADAEALAGWRQQLMARLDAGELAPASVALRLAALRSFLRFAKLASEEAIKRLLKAPRAVVLKPYNTLTAEEATRLMEVARRPRDRAMLAVMLGTGLRAAEVVGLLVGDLYVDQDGDLILRVRAGKGRKDRLVPVKPGVAHEVQRYLTLRGLEIGNERDAGRALFPSREGSNKAMTTARLRQLIDELAREAQISKSISPHTTRHTFAVMLVKQGVPLPLVQKALGHSRMDTTVRYIDHFNGLAELKRAMGM